MKSVFFWLKHTGSTRLSFSCKVHTQRYVHQTQQN